MKKKRKKIQNYEISPFSGRDQTKKIRTKIFLAQTHFNITVKYYYNLRCMRKVLNIFSENVIVILYLYRMLFIQSCKLLQP